jgi:hypothetical protein
MLVLMGFFLLMSLIFINRLIKHLSASAFANRLHDKTNRLMKIIEDFEKSVATGGRRKRW